MKYPKFIACIAHYHNIDPNITTARSLIISKLKNNQIIKSYFYFVNIDTDDDICQDIDQIVKYFQDEGNDTDVIYSTESIPLKNDANGNNICKFITKEDYKYIINCKKHENIF